MRDTALCYLRLSGRDEGEDVAPDVQSSHCLRVCEENGWTPEVADEGAGLHSAYKRTKLPVWDAIFKRALSDPKVAAVVCYDLARGWRNSAAFQQQVEKIIKAGVRVWFTVEGEVKFDKADSVLIWGFRAQLAQYESQKTSERLRAHYAGLRKKGVMTSHRALFGTSRVGSAKDYSAHLEADENIGVITELIQLYTDKHLGAVIVAERLRERGHKWLDRHGQPVVIANWHVFKTLNNLKWYRGLVPDDLLDRAMSERERRRLNPEKGNVTRFPVLLLRGVAVCAKCQCRINSSWDSNLQGRRYPSYRHPDKHGGCFDGARISARGVDAQVWDFLLCMNEDSEANREDRARLMSEPPEVPREILDRKLKRDKISKRLEELEVMRLDGDISKERYRERKAQFEQELSDLPEVKESEQRPRWTYETALDFQESLAAILPRAGQLDPGKANELMRVCFQRVEVNFESRAAHPIPYPDLGWSLG